MTLASLFPTACYSSCQNISTGHVTWRVGGGTWATLTIKSLKARRGVVDSCRRSGQKFSVLVCARFCILLCKWFDMAYNTTLRINKKSLPSSDGSPVRRVEIAPINRDYLLRETYCTDLIVFLS